ncbi:hypothetical protein F7725_017646 [Dissostichus mawsoni]|uniref:Uncharacterized protein n=1 Tax=Dissostichus mawsoni TaxID=36200 RepID=A0A7J5Z5W2_DISMA|nr:hypothetical protein F7725_017646 [Dissostichus mawsoni]
MRGTGFWLLILNISLEDTEQWVLEVKQWAATETWSPERNTSEERNTISIDTMRYNRRGYRGLHCCLLHHQYLLEQKLSREFFHFAPL